MIHPLANLLDAISPNSGEFSVPGLEPWMQGRTIYGGMSALIAYTGAKRAHPDLPPLRAAQIGFVAPFANPFTVSVDVLRQGRNVTQVRSEIHHGGQIALTALWLFGATREANALHQAPAVADWPGDPDDNETVTNETAPAFIHGNYEIRRAQTQNASGAPTIRRWIRLKHREVLDPISELILLGDTLPPGAMRAMKRAAPISSINWAFNILETEPQTADGWWLTENSSDHAADGYSSERLRLWNSDGRQVLAGTQSVAIFG